MASSTLHSVPVILAFGNYDCVGFIEAGENHGEEKKADED